MFWLQPQWIDILNRENNNENNNGNNNNNNNNYKNKFTLSSS